MTAQKVVESAVQTALIISNGDYTVAEEVGLFANRCIQPLAFSNLEKRKEDAKEELFKRYLAEKLGYMPSKAVVAFICENNL